MKKIVYFIFTISLIFFFIMNFFEYSNKNVDILENNKTVIEIEKPQNLTNEDFINNLITIFSNMNSDLMYLTTDNSNIKSHKKYYITTNTNLIPIAVNKDAKHILDNGECLSTFNSDYTHAICGSSFFYNISIYNFTEIKKFNLDLCKYYIDKDMSNKIINTLKENGFNTNKLNVENSSFKYISLQTMFLPAFLLFISMTFYVISRRKEILCQRLLGFSKLNIVIKDCFENIIQLLGITILLESLNLLIIKILYKYSFLDYFNFTYKKVIIIFIYAIVVLFLTNVFNITRNYTSYLKGNDNSLDIYIITLISKFIFCTFLIVNLSSISSYISSIYNLNKINMTISENTKNYVTLPVNVSNFYIGDNNQLELSNKAEEFYNITESKYDGVLIDSRAYRKVNNEDEDEDDTLNTDNYKKYITINGNYLKLNPLYDIENNLIGSSLFNDDYLNILIPENEDENKIKSLYSKKYKINSNNINIIKYLKNQKIYSFNPYSGADNNGLIDNPIIFIYNSKYLKNQMLNYISGQYYFLKIDSDNPFDEISPTLSTCGLDAIIHETPYISNVFNESISEVKSSLMLSLINFFVYIVGLIIMIIYNSKIYFIVYKKVISLKRINGYNFVKVYRIPLLIQWLQLIFLILMRLKFTINISIIFIVSLIELIIFILYLKSTERKNIPNILKGDN